MKKLSEIFKIEKPAITKPNLTNPMSFKQWESHFETVRNERVLSLSKALSDVMANVPESRKLIILADIVGFSQDSTREQVRKIYLFQRYLGMQVINSKMSFQKRVQVSHFVPTGDGCYIIADNCKPEIALNFLVSLISGFKSIQTGDEKPMALRASALIGSCVPILDMARHKNYIGEGMNEAARILSGGQKSLEEEFLRKNPDKSEADAKAFSENSLYLGLSLAEGIESYADACQEVVRYEGVADKHGKRRDIVILRGVQ